jgi:hypothetical protein
VSQRSASFKDAAACDDRNKPDAWLKLLQQPLARYAIVRSLQSRVLSEENYSKVMQWATALENGFTSMIFKFKRSTDRSLLFAVQA